MFKYGLWIALLMVGVTTLSACTNSESSSEKETTNDKTASVLDQKDPEPMASSNIVGLAAETDYLSTLVAAVTAGELRAALSAEDAELTVFAPTNEAFADIQATVDTLLLPENKSDLQNVLKYHVVPGKVMAADLKNGQIVTTLAGIDLKVTIMDGAVYLNDAKVTAPDLAASNGVVHVIDRVLVPGYETIVDRAVDTAALSTLVAAVTAGELVDTLADPTAEFTVFAPTNEAFAAIQDTVDTLLLPANQADLQSVLLYHVVQGKVMSSELADGQVIETVNGETLTVEINGDVVRVGGATVVTPDVETNNGVVHVIDTVLVP